MPTLTTPGQPIAQFAPGGTAYGALSRYGGTSLLGVDPNMLTSNRLAALLRSDNPIVGMASDNARSYALARGGGLDSGSMAYNAERGAMEALTPIASEEADMYGNVAAANQNALNQHELERMGNQTSIGVANIGARSALDQLRMRNQFDQQQALQSRDWQLADQDTQARASARSQFIGNMEQAIFSDPSVWRDPEGAMGMMHEFGSNFDTWFQQNYPEYFADGANNGAPPATPYQGGGR